MEIFVNYNLAVLVLILVITLLVTLIFKKEHKNSVVYIGLVVFMITIFSLPETSSSERRIKTGEEITILHYEKAMNSDGYCYFVLYKRDGKIAITTLKADDFYISEIQSNQKFVKTKKGLMAYSD